MYWRVTGQYVMGCTCKSEVHWPIDGSMSDRNGACRSVSVFRFDDGLYEDADLTGVKFALVNFFPERISKGDWQMGIVADSKASDAQASAVQDILRGEEGGPFSSVASMIGDFIGMDRGVIGYTQGEHPSADLGGRGSFNFHPTLVDDEPVLAPNAMFVFAEQYRIGRSIGKASVFGVNFALDYGEFGLFSFSSDNTGMEREFRPTRIAGVYGEGVIRGR